MDGSSEFYNSSYEENKSERYKPALKTFKPFRRKGGDNAPIDNAGLFSYVTISWLSSAIYKAKNNLCFNDLPALSNFDSVGLTGPRFHLIYTEERNKQGHSAVVGRALFRFIRSRFWFAVLLSSLSFVAALVGPPIVVNRLVSYATDDGLSVWYGVGLCFALLATDISRLLLYSASFAVSIRTLVRARSGLAHLIYWKLIRIRNFKQKSAGEMTNWLVNDLQRVNDMLLFSSFACGAPLGIIAGTVYAWFILGWTAAIALVSYILLVPLQVFLARFGVSFRKKSINLTDQRVCVITEVLRSIKTIKLCVLEQSFINKIGNLRKSEVRWLFKSGAFQILLSGITPSIPVYVTVVTLLVHTGLGYSLTADQAYTAIVIFTSMRLAVGLLPNALKAFVESLVAIRRYNELMCMEELDEYVVPTADDKNAIELRHLTASTVILAETHETLEDVKQKQRSNDTQQNKMNENDGNYPNEVNRIHDISLNLPKGSLTGICGSVGSGKSSLISTILGHLRVNLGSVAINGNLAYVPQQAWIFHASLRDNVLFGKDFDREKYERVIETCALQPDIDIFPNGDQTEIGERGITLSGGQKQRISLARAVYSERDILLLDDPLSAVDSQVSNHIFWSCIKRELRGKTVLLVTHQLEYLEHCDEVVVMKEGRLTEKGTHEQLMADDSTYAQLIRQFKTEENKKHHQKVKRELVIKDDKSPIDQDKTLFNNEKKPQTSLMIKEAHMFGSVGWKTYKVYIKAMGGYLVLFALFFSALLHIFATNATSYWITIWINQGGMLNCLNKTAAQLNETDCTRDPNIVTNPQRAFYQLVYGCLLLASPVLLLFRTATFPRAVLRASSLLHQRLLTNVMRSPMSLFDQTPIGQLLNRFSRDIDELDTRLLTTLNSILQAFCLTIMSLTTISLILPPFLIACVFFIIFFYFLFASYKSGVREFKRFANVLRSPLLSHIAATTHGLQSIHAYQKEEEFLQTFSKHIDKHSVPFTAHMNSVQWVVVRFDAISGGVNVCVATIVVIAKSYPQIFGVVGGAASAGLALMFAIQFTGLLTTISRFAMDTETCFTSVDRVREYSKFETLEKEKVVEEESTPQNSWPEHGSIRFHEVEIGYRKDLPLVLKKVTFEVKPGEKVGIVGRTGSGKSSLGVALCRLVELSGGSIHIDGVDIRKLGLDDLRKNITIIPQDPVLFRGTVRDNLDPFGRHSDQEIWQALERSHVKNLIDGLPEKLESEVLENGDNLSVGERQLVCMSRAILRKSRIIILDEATAAIDSATDSLVQAEIRDAFKDCTILTIAHRINTVLTCDKILVMEKGQVVEFDETQTLLRNSDSKFSQLFHATNKCANTDVSQHEAHEHGSSVNQCSSNASFSNPAYIGDDD